MTEPKVTRDGNGGLNIKARNTALMGNMLLIKAKARYMTDADLDELYAVLHARETAKQWRKADDYLDRIDELEASDD
jgi:hypothetical protein